MELSDLKSKIRDQATSLLSSEQSSLLTPSMIKERAALQIEETINQLNRRIAKGYSLLCTLYEKQKQTPDGSSQYVPFLEPTFFDDKTDAIISMIDKKDEEKVIQTSLGIADSDLSKAHDLAIDLFNDQRYEEAADAFFCLSSIAPDIPELLMSLAHAEFHAKHLESAATCYAIAYVANPNDPQPLIYAATCLIQLGNKDEALVYLDKATEVINNNQEIKDMDKIVMKMKQSVFG
jgi:tetratricopeptide (TPR) repeat protein